MKEYRKEYLNGAAGDCCLFSLNFRYFLLLLNWFPSAYAHASTFSNMT